MLRDQDQLRQKALAAAGSVVMAMGLLGCAKAPPVEAAAATAGGEAPPVVVDKAEEAPHGARPECSSFEDGPSVVSCCDQMRDWCEVEYAEQQDKISECIYGMGGGGRSTGCVPWGPPVPPRFRGSVLV